jgi:DNA-binding Lrp family transcriptional regulator
MVVHSLHEKETLVLEQLLLDGRAKISTIAKNTKLSRDTVEYYIKKLEKEGIIKQFTVCIDEKKIGFQKAQIFLSIKVKSIADEEKIVELIQKNSIIKKIEKCGGEYNFFLEVFVQNIFEISQLMQQMCVEFGESLTNYKTIFSDQEFKQYRGIAGFRIRSKPKSTKNKVNERSIVLTKQETQVIEYLQHSGRDSYVTIGKALKLSPDTIKYHIQKLMQKGVIQKIIPLIDYTKLGLQQNRIILHLQNTNLTTTPIIEFLQQHSFVSNVTSSVGTLELVFELYSFSNEEFYKELRELRTRYSFTIKSMGSFQILENLYFKGCGK